MSILSVKLLREKIEIFGVKHIFAKLMKANSSV